MNTNFLVSYFGFVLLFSLLSVLVEKMLIFKGYIRGKTIWLMISSFIVAIFKQADSWNSLYIYILFAAIGVPLIINRYDLSITISKGKWWWKSEQDNKN